MGSIARGHGIVFNHPAASDFVLPHIDIPITLDCLFNRWTDGVELDFRGDQLVTSPTPRIMWEQRGVTIS